LVEQDKIDTKKLAESIKDRGWSVVNYNHSEEIPFDKNEYWEELALMHLSIQDKPIEFLLSILK
jgi:hypothetical protein